MFFPPKRKAIFSALLALTIIASATDSFAQTAEFERRAAAMRRAVSRGQQKRQVIQQSSYVELNDSNSGIEPREAVSSMAAA